MGPSELARGVGGAITTGGIGLVELIVIAIGFYGGFWVIVTVAEGIRDGIHWLWYKFKNWRN